MKAEEKARCIELRRQGLSYKEIEKEVGVARSSLTRWLGDIQLTDEQNSRLAENIRINSVICGRANRTRWIKKREDLLNSYKPPLTNPEFMLGLGLYWGEGSKAAKSTSVSMANADFHAVLAFKCWIEKFFPGEFEDYGVWLIHYNQESDQEIKKYWSKMLSVPIDKFGKSHFKASIRSKRKRNTLPYGTAHLCVQGKEVWKIRKKIEKALQMVKEL